MSCRKSSPICSSVCDRANHDRVPFGGIVLIHIRSLTRTYNRDVDYQETGAYGWNDRAGSDEASGSGCSSGSGSGSAEPGWRLTSVTESGLGVGGRTLESSYNGSGSGWAESGDDDEGSESSSQWEAQRWIRQQSTSTRTLAKATSYSQGDQQSMSLDDGSGRSSSHPTDNGQDGPADPRGKSPPARDRHHPGRGRSAEHHRAPVWSHWDTLDQLFAVAPPEPAIRYEVDAAGNLLSVTDVLGHQAAYTYLCPCQLGTGEIFRESQFLAAYGGVCASARDGRWHGGLLDRPMATALC